MKADKRYLPRPFRKPVVTALEVLEKVARIIEEEPRRLDMAVFSNESRARKKHVREEFDYALAAENKWGGEPKCGTVGCICGWSGMVLGMTNIVGHSDIDPVPHALGLKVNQVQELFHPPHLTTWDGASFRARVGWRQHARLTLEHLRGFIERNREQLASRQIQVQGK